jgi:hypothetical protein
VILGGWIPYNLEYPRTSLYFATSQFRNGFQAFLYICIMPFIGLIYSANKDRDEPDEYWIST